MRVLRLLVLAINSAAGVAVLLIGLVALVVGSEAGSARVVAFALQHAPAEVRIEGIEGTLADELVLDGVSLRTGGGVVTAERAVLSFSASSFVARAAVLNRIELGDVVWSRGAVSAEGVRGPTPAAGAGAPFPIVVRDGVVNTLALRSDGRDLVLHGLRGSGRWVDRILVVDDFRGESTGVALTGRGEIGWADGLVLQAGVNWAGRIRGERAAGHLSVVGTPASLALRHELIAPSSLNARADAALVGGGVLELDRLALDTDRGTLTGKGRLVLDTTAWELTLDARGAGFPTPPPDAGSGRLHVAGRLLPRIEWRELPPSAPGPAGG